MEDKHESPFQNLKLRFQSPSLPEEVDNRSPDANAQNRTEKEEIEVIDDLVSLGRNELPSLTVMEEHAEDRGIKDVKGKVDTANTLGPPVLNDSPDLEDSLLCYAYPFHDCLMYALFK